MLVQLLDAQSAPHQVVWRGQDQINDFSGALAAGALGGGVSVPQPVAAANALRAGFLFQNTSNSPMLVFEAGNGVAGWLVQSGGYFPPNDSYPIPVGAIAVLGVAGLSAIGDTFTYREWVNGPGQ